jgi:hypothetical protein
MGRPFPFGSTTSLALGRQRLRSTEWEGTEGKQVTNEAMNFSPNYWQVLIDAEERNNCR